MGPRYFIFTNHFMHAKDLINNYCMILTKSSSHDILFSYFGLIVFYFSYFCVLLFLSLVCLIFIFHVDVPDVLDHCVIIFPFECFH